MSKERLEEIEETLVDIEFIKNQRDFKQEEIAKAYFIEEHGEWLVGYAKEQTERVTELVEEYNENLENSHIETLNLEIENKRYRDVLEDIAKELYLGGDSQYVTEQKLIRVILRARKVLEGELDE